MADAAAGTTFSSSRAAAPALLALWALPALGLAVLTLAVGPLPSAAPADAATAAGRLAGFAARMVPELFLIAWLAAPTARLVEGAAPREAARVLAEPRVLAVAAILGVALASVLSLTLLPGVLASYVNPLMATIFYVAGVIGGAAGAIQLFRLWMFAPALAPTAGSAAEALDASRALARRHRTGGFALSMAVAYALVTLAGAAVAAVAGRVVLHPAGPALAAAAVWWLGVPGIAARIGRQAAELRGAVPAAGEPVLALRSRPSQCPRCGALATVPVAGGGAEVTCAGCGLRARVV